MSADTPSERRISAITETFWNLLRDCPPAEAVAGLEIVLARAREKAGMEPTEQCVMSWGGFNIQGDQKSTDAVVIALRAQARCDALTEEIAALRSATPGIREAGLREAAEITRSFAEVNRFKVSDTWRDDMTVSEVYETAAIDVSGWIEQTILAVIPAPAPPQSGEREVETIANEFCEHRWAQNEFSPMICCPSCLNRARRVLRALDALRARAGEA